LMGKKSCNGRHLCKTCTLFPRKAFKFIELSYKARVVGNRRLTGLSSSAGIRWDVNVTWLRNRKLSKEKSKLMRSWSWSKNKWKTLGKVECGFSMILLDFLSIFRQKSLDLESQNQS
jgi:hypothetical protein